MFKLQKNCAREYSTAGSQGIVCTQKQSELYMYMHQNNIIIILCSHVQEKKIELVEGYGVYLTQRQLDGAGAKSNTHLMRNLRGPGYLQYMWHATRRLIRKYWIHGGQEIVHGRRLQGGTSLPSRKTKSTLRYCTLILILLLIVIINFIPLSNNLDRNVSQH